MIEFAKPPTATVILRSGRTEYAFPDGVPDNPTDAYFNLIGSKARTLPRDPDYAVRKRYRRIVTNKVFNRDAFFCQLCGRDMLADVPNFVLLSLDHLRPKCRGGHRNGSNLVTACFSCNQLKGHANVHSIAEARCVIGQALDLRAKWLYILQEAHR